jgi:hypothetical protein
MVDRKRRSRVYQVEALESRLTLSSVAGRAYELAPQVFTEAVKHQKITAGFQASGQATPSNITDNPDGSLTATLSITGVAKATGKKTTLSTAFGSFTGTITATSGSTSISSMIQFKKGTATVNLMSHGTLLTQGSDNGTFSFAGGSGAFANATGGGNYSVSVVGASTPNPSVSFQFMGKITVVK